MVKMLEIVKKDLKEYYRESMTFKIVLLSPILIIVVFGLIFSGGVPQTINLPVKIAVCSMDSNLPSGFIESLKQEKWVQVEDIKGYDNCDETVKQNIAAGIYKGGITVPEGFTASVISGNKSYLNVYVDNSLVGVESIIRGYLWKALKEYSQSFSQDPIASIKKEFFSASLRLKSISDSISLSQQIKDFKSNADTINSGMQSFDTQSYKKQIDSTSSNLNDAKGQIDLIYSDMKKFRTNIKSYIAELNSTRAELVKYDSETVQAKNALESLYNVTCTSKVPLFPDVMEACDQVSSSIAQLDQAHHDIQSKIAKIDSMMNELQQAYVELGNREASLTIMKADIESSQTSLSGVSGNMTFLDALKSKTKNFNEQIYSYSDDVKKNETAMKSELGNFSDSINEMLMGASVIPLNPIEVESKNTFDNMSFLDFIMPSLITLLAMFSALFLSCTTIIYERTSGTLTRNLLTPLSLSNFILGKVTSIVLVGFAELSTILLIGFFAFHIFIPLMIPQLIVCVIVSLFAFSAIGMFIGICSDSGITAVLISITFMIILLFISGITVPNELLPQEVVTVGGFLPLAKMFSLMKGLFVYNFVDLGALAYLAAVSVGGLLTCIFSIKKQIG